MLLCLLISSAAHGQRFFPVKVDKKWGLINSQGHLVLDPIYDAIGEFKHYGYAVMQRNGLVGLLGPDGREAISPRYEDIKVLDDSLVAVMNGGAWRVINFQEETVLNQGYRRVRVIRPGYLAYQRDGHWGIVDAQGRQVAPPAFDEVDPFENGWFLSYRDGRQGLIHPDGQVVLSPVADEIRRINDSLLFYRQGRLWGAVDQLGREKLAVRYESFRPIGTHFLKLFANDQFFIYSFGCHGLLPTL
ncbi:MAG: WG repeat-containing protein, partial [Lewinella sp.]|nr:WG repeat-containing protein [Lewinella sp.]